MANKSKLKSILKEQVGLTVRLPKYVGYADCALHTPVLLELKNGYSESLKLKVTLSGGELLLPYETDCVAPFESTLQLEPEGLFSPLFLAENEEIAPVAAEAAVYADGKELCRARGETLALPYDFWEGLEGNPERLACFVRPRISECARILEDAGKRLKKWNESAEFFGYAGADKNAVRMVAAAVYASVNARGIEREECDLSRPLSAFSEKIFKEKRANALQLALFAAACFESARLNPVIAVGKKGVGVGVWLYDSCFLDPVSDDREIVEKYVSDGINNLAFFDVEDLFSSRNIAFTTSEKHFVQKIGDTYEYFIDVRRCRLAGIPVLPLKEKGVRGVELLKDGEMSADSAPAPLPKLHTLAAEGKLPKNKIWERRLLDLSAKNTLLCFAGKNALHVRVSDADALFSALAEGEEPKLAEGAERPPFGVELSSAEQELSRLELKNGVLRVFCAGEQLGETARLLQRKNREADEETGAKILYLAFGFLQYVSREDGSPRHAPLVLVPADLVRAKGNEDLSLRVSEKEYFVNATLLEYLKQEFNIDIRGLGGDVSALKISEILAMVRAETAGMKGWTVRQDVYLAAFSFRRYLMWRDLHSHFDELKTNAVVGALLGGRMPRTPLPPCKEEDEGDPAGTLTPLPADSSQYSAIALSRTGASFVLHGPPGTGKSQTITNIIANALEDGKRVLFVAEKKAALDVVKKRLDEIGVGDFCLELHSDKADKAETVKKLEDTLSLAGTQTAAEFARAAEEVSYLRAELKDPMNALHKKRRLGISVYQAILLYLKNKDAPDVMDIESSFYDTLSERKLADCKLRILSAAAAAKECGGVFNSPFENVCLTEYSQGLRDKIFCSCEVLLAEIRHLKGFLGLLLEFYRQRVSTLTRKKLENVCTLARELSSDVYAAYFTGVTEEEFNLFFHANRKLDELLSFYNRHFRILVDPGKDTGEIKRALEEGNYESSKAASATAKKLVRAALHPLTKEDVAKFLQILVEIRASEERVKSVPLSKNFLDRGGEIVFKRRAEYLAPLYRLHRLCGETFLDFQPDAFNGMCLRAQNGYTKPVLDGYLKAADAFFCARDSFLKITNADPSKIPEEDILDYFSAKAGALIDNIDLLSNWCMYRSTAERLKELGCSFVSEALESGKLTGENILAGFEKNVYKNFLEINAADPELSRLSAGTLEETVEKFRTATEEFTRLTREKIRSDLISRLPSQDGEGSLAVEVSAFRRLSKSNLRGTGLRGLFAEIPELLSKLAPCMLLSPTTAAQYLQPRADLYDLVIFDEASQMTTAEAVGCIARAKSAIVVGDPKQLPPTSFFRTGYVDEENLENEDLESILDDCLALGMPEKHLLWHYRSKHESLIAFSNSMYYDNKLCTFPSPDGLKSKVRFVQVDGCYDRGFTKRNQKEAEALVAEVVRRLKDPVLSRSSMGVVTFSGAQQTYVERLVSKAILKERLESVAYEREEPLFVKNLENVQGDERDVVLFSVCYGPDSSGRVSLNFGPLNQAGGWRRLNVAVSRAREEMLVFSTMTAGMIDLSKTSSRGVAGLKAFLDYAEKGRLPVRPDSVKEGAGIGKYLAKELSGYGYDCRVDVGASDFKIDVAVVDPRAPQEFLLAVLFDGSERFSVKDRNVLQIQTLKRANWNVARVGCVGYYNNPKREVKRIKDLLDRLTGAERRSGSTFSRYSRAYRAVAAADAETAAFVTGGENDGRVLSRLKEIVAAEEPISRAFLKTRCLASFGIAKSGAKISARLDALIDASSFRKERVAGVDYFYKNDRAVAIGRFRVEEAPVLRKSEEDFTPFETVSLVKALLEERVSLYLDELTAVVCTILKVRQSERFARFLRGCIAYGEEKGVLVRSVSDRISLA